MHTPTDASTHSKMKSLDKKYTIPMSVLLIIFFLLTIVAIIFYFFVQTKSELSNIKNDATTLRIKNEKIEVAAQKQTENNNNYYQYSTYLNRERALLESMYGKSNVFSVYQYGFGFDQSSKEVPLLCQEDLKSIIIESPSGQGDLTVLCTWREDQFNKNSTEVAGTIVHNLNLVTPITFTLSFTHNPVDDENMYMKTKNGITVYRSVEESAVGTIYSYYFYSPKEVNTLRNVYKGEYVSYILELEVFDETNETALDDFAKKAIEQVNFVNLVE